MRKDDERDDILRCSFCSKSQNDVKKLIAGPTVYICDECVDVCKRDIADDPRPSPRRLARSFRSRKKSREFLDLYVIGQETTKEEARSGRLQSLQAASATRATASRCAGSALVSDVVDGQTYRFSSARQDVRSSALTTFLLPNYDEFGIAYRDREIVPSIPRPRSIAAPDIFAHLLFVGGQLVGRWKRRVLSDRVMIDAQPFRRLTKPEMSALETSAERYAKFLGVATTLRVARP